MNDQTTQANGLYSDGSIEERILNYLKTHPHDAQTIIRDLPEGTVFHNFTDARAGLLQWYSFYQDASILEIGAGMGALTPQLAARCAHVTAIEPSPNRAAIIEERCKALNNVTVLSCNIQTYQPETLFDYVLLIGVLEYAGISGCEENPWLSMLSDARRLLKPNGKLLIAIENKYGLKYWCGAAEDHTGIPFNSLNDYAISQGKTGRYSTKGGVRTFSQQELRELLRQAGFTQIDAFYPFPDYKFPMVILHGDSPAAEELVKGVKFDYPEESTLIADEQKLFPPAIRSGCLGFFSNSFLLEAAVEPYSKSNITAVSLKRDYREEYRLVTTLFTDHVTRCAASRKSETHLRQLLENTQLLEQRGVPCVAQSEPVNGITSAELITAPRGDQVFQKAFLQGDQVLIVKMLDQLRDALLKSSDQTQKNGQCVLREGFIDLTLRNSFWMENRLVFFDQEWKQANVPLNYLLYRSIRYALPENAKLEASEKIYNSCGISGSDKETYAVRETEFLQSLMDSENCYWFDRTMYQPRLTLAEKQAVQLKNRDAHIDQLLQSERDLTAEVRHKEETIAQQGTKLAEKEQTIAQQDTKLVEKEQTIAQQGTALAEKEQIIAQQGSKLVEKEQTIRNKEGYIELLLESDRELERIKSSRSWRFMGYVWKLRDGLIPKGSKRRLLGKMAVKFAKHPLHFLSKCTPHKVSKFFRALRREGVESTSRRLDDCLIGNTIPPQELMIENVPETTPKAPVKTVSDYTPLHVPQWDRPTVSIVIPVYNQFDYTYACVKSILQNSGDMTYEILIADDCSSDVTRDIDAVISGLHTIHNAENLRFLRNCNNAAKKASGKYILFLNNDTQVQPDWLAPLVALLEKDSTIGMTGSKLVYPDGRLQEAGGIFWKDASAWNYGNRSDPTAPEYNYVKDVDYISGASICIRKALWEEIGGFDDRFAPAYCEDSDLAFEVRAHGKRVVYQPLSVVVHFEGVSNGTDTSTGQKQYQVINQEKFYEKWKEVLERDHFPNGENVFQARDCTRNKKTVVVVDHYIPAYDKDAGSRTVDQYLQLLVETGYNVKLIGDNFYCNVPYARRFEQMGIEILYGVYYRDHWKDWVRENAAVIDVVFLNRPHITVKYIDFFKANTKAKIIYYGHDLHFLRERREYELTGDSALKKSSDKWKVQELGIMSKADVVFTLSTDERAIINDELHEDKAIISPIFYFRDFLSAPISLQGHHDIIFVGGFGHHPNEDGVLWFVNTMWARIHAALPCVRLIIIGSNPTEKILTLSSENIRVTGYVTDEELEDYYRKSRLCIIPLRFGAGVKGKTIEAMYHRIPIVTTSIGTEGLPGIDAYLPSTDEADAFAQRVLDLYQDDTAAQKEAGSYCAYLQQHFSYESAKKLFSQVFSREENV